MAKIKSKRPREQTCCGTIEEAKYNARASRGNKPQPWIVLKFTVGISAAIIGYSGYVYVGRFCVPMILRQKHAIGGRAIGVVFLVVFSILALMLFWTYIKVVVVSPGFARDYIKKSAEPAPSRPVPPRDSVENNSIGGTAYEDMPPPTNSPRNAHYQTMNSHPPIRQASLSEKATQPASTKHSRSSGPRSPDINTGVLDTVSPAPIPNGISDAPGLRSMRGGRMPANVPVLLPEHRYCTRDEIVKPYRTHHCRACGTCILKYDHHCPWIGQCVGARNQKFFVNFLEWVSLFCLWIFATMLGLIVKANADFDSQDIAVIALAGVFALFTVMMLISQVRMVGLNQTTVESVQHQTMKERERATISRLHPFHHFRAKAETKRMWDEEWGKIDTEGNLWWLGSFRANWESVMGENVWWWFLPIGRSASNGLLYPINPRFDEQGRWKRRKEWPAELR